MGSLHLTYIFHELSNVKLQRALATLTLIAMPFDYCENVLIAIMLFAYPQERFGVASAASLFTKLKWIFVLASLAAILYKGEPFADKVPFSEMFHAAAEATHRLKCAEAEKIVLGHVAPSTAAALADCERRALDIIEAARRKHEKAEEKRRLEEERGRQHRE